MGDCAVLFRGWNRVESRSEDRRASYAVWLLMIKGSSRSEIGRTNRKAMDIDIELLMVQVITMGATAAPFIQAMAFSHQKTRCISTLIGFLFCPGRGWECVCLVIHQSPFQPTNPQRKRSKKPWSFGPKQHLNAALDDYAGGKSIRWTIGRQFSLSFSLSLTTCLLPNCYPPFPCDFSPTPKRGGGVVVVAPDVDGLRRVCGNRVGNPREKEIECML